MYPMKCKGWDVLVETLHRRKGILPQILCFLMLKPLPWCQSAAANQNHRAARTSGQQDRYREKAAPPFPLLLSPNTDTDCRARARGELQLSMDGFISRCQAGLDLTVSSDTKHPLVQYLSSEPP